MQLTITINCDNAAFDKNVVTESIRILDEARALIRVVGITQTSFLHDINGKKVGSISWTDKESS